MITSICLVIIFLSICIAFGFLFLYRLGKINSLVYLIPFSVSFGISAYIFICHLLSFLFGPKRSSLYSLAILLVLSIILLIINYINKVENKLITEISKDQLIFVFVLSLVISICIFSSGYRYGMFDEAWHIPLATSIYHNDIYPPRDFLRPDYALIYHFGGDLLAGAITHICKTDILTSFELISGLFSGVSFLNLFSLAWLFTKSYRISIITAFCCFFGSGLIWFNAILEYIKNQGGSSFLTHFLRNGIYGTITNSLSSASFSSTSSIGFPVLIFCFLSFWFLIDNKNDPQKNIFNILSLTISLFSLSLFAGWLSLTFIISISAYWIIDTFTKLLKKEGVFTVSITIFIVLGIFLLFNKLFGNQMYSPDEFLGRANIFNIALKKQFFTITAWNNSEIGNALTASISCFSFKFFCAFGLSLILLPIVFIYLIKHKEKLSLLLFLSAALTMPLPLLFDFKLNPVDFNRLFGFGNIMLILLITVGIHSLFSNIFQIKSVTLLYIFLFCFSPLCGFIVGTAFSPQIYLHPHFTKQAIQKLQEAHSLNRFISKFIEINKDAIIAKNAYREKYKNEIAFFSKNGKPKDVAVSSIQGIPIYSGVYTLIPSMTYGLKGQIYSSFDNIHPTIISTLDPHLISELNVKWVAYDEISKSKLNKDVQALLNNKDLFKLAYSNYIIPESNKTVFYEIFHIEDLSGLIKEQKRKTAWILVNKDGFPIEITGMLYPSISLFPSERNTLYYLKELHMLHPNLKNELITAQPIIIETTKQQLKESGLNIQLEEKL